ncbi:30S ribosomal protein S17 [Candidatus Parcubacteria bacterium]|nr:MAG: 30S ribosomal protein S17 [Candidatus Parcubacteria bacterium]
MSDKKSQTQTQTSTNRPAIRRVFKGVVVSDKMDKTIVVKVERVKVHPKYKKRFVVSKRYKVHDEKNQFRTGDEVQFAECRPLSKEKRWRVLYSDSKLLKK